MRNQLVVAAVSLLAMTALPPSMRAQAAAQREGQGVQSQARSSKVPDLSGDWNSVTFLRADLFVQSVSVSDPGGKLRGKEPDIPYQPSALQKTLSEYPPTGPEGRYDVTTDPYIHYCEPLGVVRVYMYPARTKFVQTADSVYILYEQGEQFRVVRINSKHPDDPDPQYWGDSIGWYENGNTFVVDSVGFNDRSWLDQVGHPHSDKLHLIEHYKLVDKDHLHLDMTIDDLGAYTKPFPSHRDFNRPKVPFMQNPWVCSTRENQEHTDHLATPAMTPNSK